MKVMGAAKWKRLFARQAFDFLGIDIGTAFLKVAEVSWKADRPTLNCAGVTHLPQNIVADGKIIDSDALTEVLKKLCSTCGAACRNAVSAIGKQAVFVRELSLPVMDGEELKEALKWEAEQYVPYAPGTYYQDFSVAGSGQTEQEMKVLLVAAQHSVVNDVVQVIKNAGLRPAAIDIEPLALYRTVTGTADAMIVDMGKDISQVAVFRDGSPTVIRNLPFGGQKFTSIIMSVLGLNELEAERLKCRQNGLLQRPDAERTSSDIHRHLRPLVDEVAYELRRTIDYYQVQHKEAIIENIFLTGGGAQLHNLAANLAAQLDLPVAVHDPLQMLDIIPSLNRQYLAGIAPQLSVSIGLGMRAGDIP